MHFSAHFKDLKAVLALLFGLLSLAFLSGCASRDGGVSFVRISPSIQTRVTGLHFDTEDQIGLSIVLASGTYADNALLTFDGTSFSSTDLVWYDGDATASTLTAYYPYSESGVPQEFSIASDQRGGCTASDLLGAVKKDVMPSSSPVGMVFSHLLSQVSVIVLNSSGSPVTGVSLGGFVPTALIDFENLSAAPKSGVAAAQTKAFEVVSGSRYRAVLVPQEGQLTVAAETSDGKTYSKSVPAALVGGLSYDVTLEITKESVSVDLSGEIKDWGSGGSLDGGSGGENASPGTVSHDGITYQTRRVGSQDWMAENLRYMPAGVIMEQGVWNPVGGADAIASQGLLYNYATASGGAATLSTDRVRGICPEGWHIPTAEELAALLAADCGADFFVAAGCMVVRPGSDNKYSNTDGGYLMSSTLTTDGKCTCLKFTGDGQPPQLTDMPTAYGLSLRCVKDVN